jgi:hypothetical protein
MGYHYHKREVAINAHYIGISFFFFLLHRYPGHVLDRRADLIISHRSRSRGKLLGVIGEARKRWQGGMDGEMGKTTQQRTSIIDLSLFPKRRSRELNIKSLNKP